MKGGFSSQGSVFRPGRLNAGFTLVELVVVLTIVALMIGVSIPSIVGLQKEAIAREPIAELAKMAREVRSRAIAEQRPYQIAFDSRGFHAARYFNPYGESEEFDQLVRELEVVAREREIIEASQARGIDLSDTGVAPTADEVKLAAVEDGMQFYQSYELADGVSYELHYWADTEWINMSDGAEFRRWVFQPTGMCQPLEIRIQSDNAFFEVEFAPLTGTVKREQSWVE